jgi:hypothetical protein
VLFAMIKSLKSRTSFMARYDTSLVLFAFFLDREDETTVAPARRQQFASLHILCRQKAGSTLTVTMSLTA